MTTIEIYNVSTHCSSGSVGNTATACPCIARFHPFILNRFATGGADNNIFIWKFSNKFKSGLETISKLMYHTSGVNCIEWDHSGTYLASGGVDKIICVWRKKSDINSGAFVSDFGTGENSIKFCEKWEPLQVLRGQLCEIQDICWTNDNRFLICSSLDGTIGVYDVFDKKRMVSKTDIHIQFIQGIALDSRFKFLAIQHSNASCKIFKVVIKKTRKSKTKTKTKAKKQKSVNDEKQKMEEESKLESFSFSNYCTLFSFPMNTKTVNANAKTKKRHKMFVSNVVQTSKKLEWSPDSMFLCCVAGQSRLKKNCIHLFHRSNLTKKVSTFSMPESSVPTCVRFLPFPLALSNDVTVDKNSVVDKYCMKYRLLFSVICSNEIFIFDSSQLNAVFYWKDTDSHNFLDMTWSFDGKMLLISDVEGFLTKITFASKDIMRYG